MSEMLEEKSRGPAPAQPRPRRVIARRLAVSFGLVSVVTVAMYGMLLSLVGQVSGLVLTSTQLVRSFPLNRSTHSCADASAGARAISSSAMSLINFSVVTSV